MSSSSQICNYSKLHIYSHNQNNVQEANISTTPEELFDKIIENSSGFGASLSSIKESIPPCYKVSEIYGYSDDGKTTHKVFFISQLSSSDVNKSLENDITFAILTDRNGFNPEFIPSENII